MCLWFFTTCVLWFPAISMLLHGAVGLSGTYWEVQFLKTIKWQLFRSCFLLPRSPLGLKASGTGHKVSIFFMMDLSSFGWGALFLLYPKAKTQQHSFISEKQVGGTMLAART